MRKILLIFFILIGLTSIGQKNISEGIIIQKQTFSSSNSTLKDQLAMLGDMQTITYFKNNKSRTDLSNPMTGDVTTIIDNDKKEMLVMMNNPLLGKTYVTKELKISEEELNAMTVIPSTETKEILGYMCKKYDVVLNNDGVQSKLTMYTTDQISALSDQTASLGGKVDGFPLSVRIEADQMGMDFIINMEVVEIKNEKVDNLKFDMTIPEGYERTESLK